MAEYRVTWTIDVEADSAWEAAQAALARMQEPIDLTDSYAPAVFDVWPVFLFGGQPGPSKRVDLANRYTLESDRVGGAVLTDTRTGDSRYFQPGDDAAAVWERLEGDYVDSALAAEYFAG